MRRRAGVVGATCECIAPIDDVTFLFSSTAVFSGLRSSMDRIGREGGDTECAGATCPLWLLFRRD
jgi:hypothetical protein